MKEVTLPNGDIIEFPDTASEAEISTAIRARLGERERGDTGTAADFARGASFGISNLVGAPVDALTATANLVPGVNISQPAGGSAWWRKALNAPARALSGVTNNRAPSLLEPKTSLGKAGEIIGPGLLTGGGLAAQAVKRGLTSSMIPIMSVEGTANVAAGTGAAGAEYFDPNNPITAAVASGLAGAGAPTARSLVNLGRSAAHAISPSRRAYRSATQVLPGRVETEQELARLGPDSILGDVTDQATRRLEAAYNRPGQHIDEVSQALEGRSVEQAGEMLASVGPDRFDETMEAIYRTKSQDAGPLYRQAYAQDIEWTPGLAQMWLTPTVQRLWKSGKFRRYAEDIASAEGLPYSPSLFETELPSVQGLDFLVRGIDRVIGQAKRSDPNAVGPLTQIRQKIVSELPEAAPALRAARRKWAGAAHAEELVEEGSKKFLSGRARDVERRVAELSPDELSFYRIGAVEALTDKIDRLGFTHDVTKLFRNPAAHRRMRLLFDSGDEFDSWLQKLEASARKQRTFSQVTGGSQTARRQAEMTAAEELLGVVLDILPRGQQVGRAGQLMRRSAPGSTATNEGVARTLIGRRYPSPPPQPHLLPPAGYSFLPGLGAASAPSRGE